MSDNDTPGDLDLLIASMDDLAREIGEEPDDPVRAERLKELYTLTNSVNRSKPRKARGSAHSTECHEFLIPDRGLKLPDVYTASHDEDYHP
jgi:hypothetical protein